MRQLAGKREESIVTNNIASLNEFYLPVELCRCSSNDLKRLLALLNGPGPLYLRAYQGRKAQTIFVQSKIPDSGACRLADGGSLCERPSLKFLGSKMRLLIKQFPNKGGASDEQTLELILQPQSDDPLGHQKVLVTTYLPSQKDMPEYVNIQYLVDTSLYHKLKLQVKSDEDLPEPKEMGQPRQLQTIPNIPAAPTTAISGTNVIISWTAPNDGGSPITDYSVFILQSDGTTSTCVTSCTGPTLSCSFAISLLQSSPYFLVGGSWVLAKVAATNAIGPSSESASGLGVILTVPSVPAAPTTQYDTNSKQATITWVAPADNGSVITAYDVWIGQNNAQKWGWSLQALNFIYYRSTTSCTVPLSILISQPILLSAGMSIEAKVTAANANGSSMQSSPGNGAVMPAIPSTPNSPTTAIVGTDVVISWVAPADNGSTIAGYTIYIAGSGTFRNYGSSLTTSVTVPVATLEASPYSLKCGDYIMAILDATNAFGSSGVSSWSNNDVMPPGSTIPCPPAAPTTANSGTDVTISWTAPVIGGSVIIGYTVQIKNSGGTFTAESANCNVSKTSCTIPISVLQALPFTLAWGDQIYATVQATNAYGSSAVSTPGNGAVISAIPSVPIAPTTAIQVNNVAITWIAPANNGSAITGYQVKILESNLSTFIVTQCIVTMISCTISCSCTVKIPTLQAVPFSLAGGTSIYAKVLATNAIGSSSESAQGNGAVMPQPSVPAAPATSINSNISVTITWTAPANNGSLITGYTVAIRQSDGITYITELEHCNVSTTNCSVPISTLLAYPYNLPWGSSIYATVIATNLFGSSVSSSSGNGAVITTNPGAPTLLQNDEARTTQSAIAFRWVVPTFTGGTPLIDYQVSWDQGSSNYVVIAQGITTTSYTTTAPLTQNTVYKFKVKSQNAFGFSSFSNEVLVAIKQLKAGLVPTAPLLLQNNATVTASGIVGFSWSDPSSDGGNVVIDYKISYKFGGGAYSVLATGITKKFFTATSLTTDVIYTFKVNARNSVGYGDDSVELNLAAAKSGNQSLESVSVTNFTTARKKILSIDEGNQLLEMGNCTQNAAKIISCRMPGEPYFYMNPITGQFTRDQNTPQSEPYTNKTPPRQPTFVVTKLSPKGQFSIKFSEPVGVEDLIEYSYIDQAGLLKATRSRSKTKITAIDNSTEPTEVYILSDKHLLITVQSDNKTKPDFSWNSTNITSTEIMIQMYFLDPLSLSNQSGILDKLVITTLPPFIGYLKTLASGTLPDDPLRTVIKEIPAQVILGDLIDSVESAAITIGIFGMTSNVGNIVVQILLSGSMGQMWSMVNAQQILMSYQLLNMNVPGNVILVMTNFANICDFNIFPTDTIMNFLFYFTPTDAPGSGFAAMGNDNTSLTLYLGSAFFFIILAGLQYLLYGLAYTCRKYDLLFNRIEKKLGPGLIWGTIQILLIETYLDFAIGSALRIQQPKFETASDCFDFGLAIVGIQITVVFPLTVYFFLRKNSNSLEDEEFKAKHGGLYDGFTIHTAEKRLAGINIVGWFLFRRFLTGVNLVYLRNESIWIQLTMNMWLTLVDVCIKIHLSPYESRVGGLMEKLNDCIVLTYAYFPYLFTDLVPKSEDKYFIGWFAMGVVGILIAVNLFVMLKTAQDDVKEKVTDMIKKCRLKAATDAFNAKKKAKEEFDTLLQELLKNGGIIMKPLANDVLSEDSKMIVELQKAFKRYERKMTKQAKLAGDQVVSTRLKLSVIPELDEISEIELSEKPVRKTIQAEPIESEVACQSSSWQFSSSQVSQSLEAVSLSASSKFQSAQNESLVSYSSSSFDQDQIPQLPKAENLLQQQEQEEKADASTASQLNSFDVMSRMLKKKYCQDVDQGAHGSILNWSPSTLKHFFSDKMPEHSQLAMRPQQQEQQVKNETQQRVKESQIQNSVEIPEIKFAHQIEEEKEKRTDKKMTTFSQKDLVTYYPPQHQKTQKLAQQHEMMSKPKGFPKSIEKNAKVYLDINDVLQTESQSRDQKWQKARMEYDLRTSREKRL